MSKQSDPNSTQVLSRRTTSHQILGVESALIQGDLSKLSEADRIKYYLGVCESIGLNPATKPFDYIVLNGKTVLYATKNCTEQLRSMHSVSVRIKSRETIGDCYVVTASADLPDGRVDESLGAVSVAGLKGDALCNALMKAETKAKRRVTLSICGLGMLDETELDTVKDRIRAAPVTAPEAIKPAPAPEPKPEPVAVQADVAEAPGAFQEESNEFAVRFVNGPHKGKMICDLSIPEATEYFATITSQLKAINKPPETLFGPSKTVYFTLQKYIQG